MRGILLGFALILAVCTGCRTIIITEVGKYGPNGFSGLRNTVNTSLADVRNTESMVTIDDKGDDQGMQLVLNKTEASEQFMGMVTEVAPELIDLFQTALITRGATAVGSSLSGLIGGVGEGDVPVVDGVPPIEGGGIK